MRAVLVLGGDPPTDKELGLLRDATLVVATDGGAGPLLHRKISPHRIIGDLDSLSENDRRLAEDHGVPIDVHPRAKAETDGEIALSFLLAQRPDEIVLLGGHGGRAAMFLTHMRLLRRAAEAGVPATMYGHDEAVLVLPAPTTATLARSGILDLVAMEPAVVALRGTTYDGVHTLEPWTGQGVSNPVPRPGATVHVQTGVVIVILEGAVDDGAFRLSS